MLEFPFSGIFFWKTIIEYYKKNNGEKRVLDYCLSGPDAVHRHSPPIASVICWRTSRNSTPVVKFWSFFLWIFISVLLSRFDFLFFLSRSRSWGKLLSEFDSFDSLELHHADRSLYDPLWSHEEIEFPQAHSQTLKG